MKPNFSVQFRQYPYLGRIRFNQSKLEWGNDTKLPVLVIWVRMSSNGIGILTFCVDNIYIYNLGKKYTDT